jgi:hypothetical protein
VPQYQYAQRYKNSSNRLDHVLVALNMAFSIWIQVSSFAVPLVAAVLICA